MDRNGAVSLSRVPDISEVFIGLTVIALGRSLPELAACKGNADIAVGNVVDSNIFNLPFVLGGAPPLSGEALGGGLVITALYRLHCSAFHDSKLKDFFFPAISDTLSDMGL